MLFHIQFRLQGVIIDLSHTPTHDSIYISPVALHDIENENIGIYSRRNFVAIVYKLYKQRSTLFHVYFQFQTAIFDFSVTLMLSCTKLRPTMLFDSKDMQLRLKFHIILLHLHCQV